MSRGVFFFFCAHFSAKQIEQGQSAVGLWGPRQAADQPEIGDSFLEAAT